MHHDPRYYSEPDHFDPDRWNPDVKTRLPRFTYFPFGGEPKSCMGESFAWTEGILVSLLLFNVGKCNLN